MMSTTLNKLEYLDETKGQIKTALNQFGAGITDETTFRDYTNKIEGIYNNWPKVTGSGTEITLNNTKATKMVMDVKGNSMQETTTGANILKFSERSTTAGGNTYVCSSKGIVTLTNTTTATQTFAYNQSANAIVLNAGNYKLKFIGTNLSDLTLKRTDTNETIVLDDNNEATINISSDNTSFRVTVLTTIGTTYNATYYITLTPGETATTELYTGGVSSPNSDYPQTIYNAGDNESIKETITSKNKFNINGTYNKSNCNYTVSDTSLTLTATSSYGNVSQEISNLEGNKQYRLSFEGDNAAWIRIQDSNNTQIAETYNSKGLVFTTPANGTIKIRLYVTTSASSGTRTFSNIQLEKGSVNTSYVDYAEQNITIPCQQPMRSVNTVRDEFVKISDTWYERHNIAYIASYDGETITTDYMSTTGGLDTGASVQYVAETPTDLTCTEAQITVLEGLQQVVSYDTQTNINTTDTTPAYVEASALEKGGN